tara:strand:- start:4414 stop:4788 length:375 start_codon:yes stop_codon:yes gene_type:complete
MRFTTPGPLRPVIACHCSQCRKSSGHFVAATSAARDEVAITGEVTWYQSSERARRGFCATCGSQMFWDGLGDNLSIFAGCFDGATGVTISGHIFCADKGDYYEITDGLAQADADDTALTAKFYS